MLVAIIILAILLAVSAFYCWKLRNQNNEITLKNESDIKIKNQEIKELNAKIKNLETENNKYDNSVSELKQVIENHKFKMVEMLKHLLALQKTILPEKNYIKSIFPDFFVLDQPGDTAGGDFYKFYHKGDFTLVACGNTGISGVNGLIKGILNVVFLTEILERNDIAKISSGQILDMLRSKYAHLTERNENYRVNEDIPVNFTVCIINQKEKYLQYAGAYGSMCLLRKSYPGTSRKEIDVHEFRGDRMNFAVSYGRRKNYATEQIELVKDDKIYLKTDGFANQRGGNGNRFGDSYLRQMFMKHANEPMLDQMHSYKQEFANWKGNNTKANDILVIGLALKVKNAEKPIQFTTDFEDEFIENQDVNPDENFEKEIQED